MKNRLDNTEEHISFPEHAAMEIKVEQEKEFKKKNEDSL